MHSIKRRDPPTKTDRTTATATAVGTGAGEVATDAQMLATQIGDISGGLQSLDLRAADGTVDASKAAELYGRAASQVSGWAGGRW